MRVLVFHGYLLRGTGFAQAKPNSRVRGVMIGMNVPYNFGGRTAPVDEIMSGRADVAPIDKVAWFDLEKKLPGLVSFPPGDACLTSTELPSTRTSRRRSCQVATQQVP